MIPDDEDVDNDDADFGDLNICVPLICMCPNISMNGKSLHIIRS